MKVGYKLKLDGEKTYSDRRVISKIIKFDENNQYGYATNKPSPTSCLKEQKRVPTWVEFNLLKIGNLLVVNMRFNKEQTALEEYMYYEIYLPIFEK